MKYEFTGETKIEFGVTLRRIRRIDTGEAGGWIESETNLDASLGAWVSDEALVSGNAQVSDEARVFGKAQVSGEAMVSGEAQVSGNAEVSDEAWVFGKAVVLGENDEI